MNKICPHCYSEDTLPFSDIKTKEFGYICNTCKKEFGVFNSLEIDNLIHNFKSLEIEYSYDNKIYKFNFKKKDNSIILKIDTYIDNNHNDYEEVDFSSLFDDFILVLLHQLFILDIINEDINKDNDYFILKLEADKTYMKQTNKFSYYIDLITKFLYQLLG